MLRGDVIQMEEEEQYLIWSERLLSKRKEKRETHTIVLKAENFHFSLHQIVCMHQISFRPGF